MKDDSEDSTILEEPPPDPPGVVRCQTCGHTKFAHSEELLVCCFKGCLCPRFVPPGDTEQGVADK